MMSLSKYRVVFSVAFSVVMCFLVWLVLGDSSPFAAYFLYHVTLPNLLRQLLIVPYLVLMIANPSTPMADSVLVTILEFAQWCLIGYLLSRLIFRK